MSGKKHLVKRSHKPYHLAIAVPGFRKGDLRVAVEDGTLTVSGERKSESEEKKKGAYRWEESYGAFQQVFTLPERADARGIKAALKGETLTLDIPLSGKASPAKCAVTVR